MWEKSRGGVENPYEYNPYANHRPSVLRLKGSVIPHVLLQTITVSIVAAIITVLFVTFEVKLNIPNTFTPIIGIVVGLLLTYRTNTAYDRYWEGRRLWSTMTVQIRNMTRYVWVGVREDDQKNIDAQKEVGVSQPEIIVAKKSVLNLLLGFAIALKHYLREEAGCGHKDLKELIANIQSTLPGFRPMAAEDPTTDSHAIKVGWYSKLFLRKLKPYQRAKGDPYPENHNLPLEIALYLSSYIKKQSTDKRISDPICSQLLNALNGLCDCLSQFERILRSPIPLAYSIHLSQTVWIYCLSLPFQLVSVNRWSTIPVVFFSALILFGLERIGAEIENPFGYDYNDLDLDDFCGLLKRELNTISSHPPPSVKDWIYTPENHPFPNLDINAVEASKLTPDEVRSLLERSSLEIQETVETGKIAETIVKTGTPEEEKEANSKGKNKTHDGISVDVSVNVGGNVGGDGD